MSRNLERNHRRTNTMSFREPLWWPYDSCRFETKSTSRLQKYHMALIIVWGHTHILTSLSSPTGGLYRLIVSENDLCACILTGLCSTPVVNHGMGKMLSCNTWKQTQKAARKNTVIAGNNTYTKEDIQTGNRTYTWIAYLANGWLSRKYRNYTMI